MDQRIFMGQEADGENGENAELKDKETWISKQHNLSFLNESVMIVVMAT